MWNPYLFNATGSGVYRFSVTVRHADEGWDHYADRWEVLTSDGTLLATRTLYHPHVNEQPFHPRALRVLRNSGRHHGGYDQSP
jgi:hypothetical protein